MNDMLFMMTSNFFMMIYAFYNDFYIFMMTCFSMMTCYFFMMAWGSLNACSATDLLVGLSPLTLFVRTSHAQAVLIDP